MEIRLDCDGPIGVMDSGMGGISVLRELAGLLPHENFVFYGDSANAPYGSRSTEEIYQMTENVVQKLLKRGVKAVVIACNTASSAAGARLRAEYPELPIVAIEPALKPAVIACPGGRVVVLATEATLRERKFARLLTEWQGKAEIIKLPLPGLPEFVERGELDSPQLREFLQGFFVQLADRPVDGVVLGCTHYFFLREAIGRFFAPGTPVLDANRRAADALRRTLEENGMAADETRKGETVFMTTGGAQDTARMQRVFERLLMNRL